jgi:hypothetical protein
MAADFTEKAIARTSCWAVHGEKEMESVAFIGKGLL